MKNIRFFSLIIIALICNNAYYGQTFGCNAVSAASETFLGFNHVPDSIYTRILQTQTLTYSYGDFFYLPLNVSQRKGGIYFIKVVDILNFQGQVQLIKF